MHQRVLLSYDTVNKLEKVLFSHFARDAESIKNYKLWIPAFAGMTIESGFFNGLYRSALNSNHE